MNTIVMVDRKAEESDEAEDDGAGERTTRVGRPRGGMKVALRELARDCERRDILGRERAGRRLPRDRVGDG